MTTAIAITFDLHEHRVTFDQLLCAALLQKNPLVEHPNMVEVLAIAIAVTFYHYEYQARGHCLTFNLLLLALKEPNGSCYGLSIVICLKFWP